METNLLAPNNKSPPSTLRTADPLLPYSTSTVREACATPSPPLELKRQTRSTHRQADRHTDRQTDRPRARQTHTHRHAHTHTITHTITHTHTHTHTYTHTPSRRPGATKSIALISEPSARSARFFFRTLAFFNDPGGQGQQRQWY